MKHTETEPRLSSYLHSRACRNGTPLAGNFELTPRCNFNCRMCYVHLTAEEQKSRGEELTADEWLAIAEQARSQGMLFLLITGGEPLIRTDFQYILTELKKMGIMISINSNASLIDDDWIEFFRHEPPSRFNITLYGSSNAAYERLCGRPMFDRVVGNIKSLKDLGIDVKLNASMTPYNIDDMEGIYAIAEELGTPIQMASYMFPPVRRDETLAGSNDRFSFCEAAECSLRWDKLRFSDEEFAARAKAMKDGIAVDESDVCEGTPGEKMACRAGRSSFWINWRGVMTPCGMMVRPEFSVPEIGFSEAWERTKAATALIRLPQECVNCRYKHICHACAAMCAAETGAFDKRPEYVCRMSEKTAELTFAEYERLMKNEN